MSCWTGTGFKTDPQKLIQSRQCGSIYRRHGQKRRSEAALPGRAMGIFEDPVDFRTYKPQLLNHKVKLSPCARQKFLAINDNEVLSPIRYGKCTIVKEIE